MNKSSNSLRIIFGYAIGLICGAVFVNLYYIEIGYKEYPINVRFLQPEEKPIYAHSERHIGEAALANALAERVRVFCWIVTMPKNHQTRAKHVKSTWATRCNGYLFMSSEEDPSLPSAAVTNSEGRNLLWNKTASSLILLAQKYSKDYDYFLKADDDTYVIVENLRKILIGHDSQKPFIMGRRFKPFIKQGYMSGGGGYVLSRSALLKIVDGLHNNPSCRDNRLTFAEDVKLGLCAEAVNVTIVDSMDAEGRECFHPFSPTSMITSEKSSFPGWFLQYNYNSIQTGFNCCSDLAVSFHYISPNEMYLFEYMLYHLHPYGIHRDYLDLLKFLQTKKAIN